MRTVFISEDSQLCDRIHDDLTLLNKSITAGSPITEKSWLVGNKEQVAAEIETYRQRLGMNYLIVARPRVKGLNPAHCEQSMRHLAALVCAGP
jgi:alkanesulfonate monooxygenase SsuD/methylene tetrahydromethanopterin reductase-like flavin-dependent oxidoreductase (luciferase family)